MSCSAQTARFKFLHYISDIEEGNLNPKLAASQHFTLHHSNFDFLSRLINTVIFVNCNVISTHHNLGLNNVTKRYIPNITKGYVEMNTYLKIGLKLLKLKVAHEKMEGMGMGWKGALRCPPFEVVILPHN